MKKILLLISFVILSLVTYALNPFAYALSSTLSDDQSRLTVNYTLNADATSVSVRILKNGQEVKKDTYTGTAKNKGAHTLTVDMTSLPAGAYTWDVQVTGNSVSVPTQESTSYSFFCPQGLAIDKDPNSEYFGRILMTEAMQNVPASGYKSSGKGAGIYVFNPDFTTDGVVHKGGNNFTRILATNGYQPWRVKISDDGRIFVSSLDLNGVAVWEVSKDLNTWTPVISGTNDATDYTIKKNGNFFAGPNCSMDVTGSGDNLKLLLYSTTKEGIAFTQSGYRLDEYALGKATTFTGTPKNIINGGYFGVTHNLIDVVYDGEGGYWFGASRGNFDGQPNLVHIKSDGTEDYRDETITFHGGGGILIYNGMLFKGLNNGGATNGKFRVYTIGKDANGDVALAVKWNEVISTGLKRYHNAFAVDYAENLYVVGNSGEKMIAFRLPYSGMVTTPAASKYAFSLGQLNPFAYNLYATQESDGKMTLHFSINSTANNVRVVLIDSKECRYELRNYARTDAGVYSTTITMDDISAKGIPTNEKFSWQVEVDGTCVGAPVEVGKNYSLYHPSSIDIDNNPENSTFGLILTNEAMHAIKGKTGTGAAGIAYSNYLSNNTGAGIYAFDAAFNPIKNGSTYGFNGGNNFTTTRFDNDKYTAYSPRRIRFSDDGRIFVTSLNTDGTYLWEVNPENLNRWTTVFQGGTLNTTTRALEIGGEFMVGPNTGFDVTGRGENLKLLMLSADPTGMVGNDEEALSEGFKLSEYNLGSAPTWSQLPSRNINLQDKVVNYKGVQVQYDNDGGVWLCQYRAVKVNNEPTLVYFDANGDIKYEEPFVIRNYGAIRFNHDFSKVIIATTDTKATIYSVSKDANGVPNLTEETVIDMATIGKHINDFAWDYAGNLYACGNWLEKVVAWAMPYSGTVVTPAPTKQGFELSSVYDDAQLNPYAYDLRTVNDNGAIKLYYCLNADAKRVQVILMDNEKEYVFRDYPVDGTTIIHRDGYYETLTQADIDRMGLPIGVPLRWKVIVDGKTPIKPILTPNAVPFSVPNSVAIDNDVESPYFARVLVVESGHAKSGSSFYSSKNGIVQGGIYAFRPELYQTHYSSPGAQWYAPWDVNYTEKCYNGNKDFQRQISGYENTRGYQPWMVRISDDGRIFVSSMDARKDGTVVWELQPDDLNSWSDVIKGTLDTETGYVKVNGNFLAGISCSMDVKGRGENLKLLLYSVNKSGMSNFNVYDYKLHEYSLGQQAQFKGTPTHISHFGEPIPNSLNYIRYAHISYHAKVSYDGDNGFWFGGAHTGNNSNTEGIVMAYSKKEGDDYTRILWDNISTSYTCYGGSGVKVHMVNGEKILFKGVNGNKLRFYQVNYDQNGTPTLTDKNWDIALPTPPSQTTCRLNDFAVDYANNLYTVDPHHEKVMTIALPYSGSVTTPAAERYSFTVGDPVPCIVAYNLSCTPNLNSRTYNFSFCANMPATEGKISFHKNDGSETLLAEYAINQQITQGTNIVSYEMDEIDKMLNGEMDIIWKLHLRAESSVFGEIYKSEQLNTAYATIDASPTSDFFGQIYAANHKEHNYPNHSKTGQIKVWTPNGEEGNIYTTKSTITQPLGATGFELPYRPGVAPDGTVYFTDGGSVGNIYMMNPNNNTVKSFYSDYTNGDKSLFYLGGQVIGAPSSSAHVYWDNSGAKLFTTRSEFYNETVGQNSVYLTRHNNGYFIYNLDQTAGVGQHTWTGQPTAVTVNKDNIYSTLFTVVGTSHGAWLCQHRRKGKDMREARSLMFYGNDGERKYVSTNVDMINGTPGSGLAMSKDERTLAITSGDAGIMLFDVTWNGDVPTLTHRQTFSILNNGFITSLNFDYAGNLVATIGETYNDSSDEHRMVVYALPKADNSIVIPTRYSQRMPALFADEREDVELENNLQNNYQTVDVYRPLVAGMCNTICLPFAIENKVGTPYENTRIFAFTEVKKGNDQVELQFTEVNKMQAGIPYLIQPESDITDLVRFTNVAPMEGTTPGSVTQGSGTNAITFHGAIDPTTLSVNQNCLFLVANNRLATASAGGDMLGMRGYFTVKGEFPAKAVISFREGVTTGTTSTVTPTTDGVQKVLHDQQILIIRDGETYNILGEHINTK